jgi:quercetin dioxygenase-like cupin family protein
MHVTPNDLRMVQQDRTVIRFALLDAMAFVLAEIPATGSSGASIEQPCVRPHWGFVTAGDVEFEWGSRREKLRAGCVFHVPPGGPPHRFVATGSVRIAGFESIDPWVEATDARFAQRGFDALSRENVGATRIIPATVGPLPDPKQIEVRTWPMSSLVMAQTRFGQGSGYTTEWCDAPHWGLVTSGRIAIEWENDVEILSAGDVYYCPAGPPGHRMEAADPASVIDLTPTELAPGTRVAPWRIWPSESALAGADEGPIAVAGLG